MTPEQAKAIARRIGMTLDFFPGLRTNDGSLAWADPACDWPLTNVTISTEGLGAYLATGDRPLRVMRAYLIGVGPDLESDSWEAAVFTSKADGSHLYETAEAATPEAAILACAAAIEAPEEGEGHE